MSAPLLAIMLVQLVSAPDFDGAMLSTTQPEHCYHKAMHKACNYQLLGADWCCNLLAQMQHLYSRHRRAVQDPTCHIDRLYICR